MTKEIVGFSLEQVVTKRASLELKLEGITANLALAGESLLADQRRPHNPLTAALLEADKNLRNRLSNWEGILGKWIDRLAIFERVSEMSAQLPRLQAARGAGALRGVSHNKAISYINEQTVRLTAQIVPLFDKSAPIPVSPVLPEPAVRPIITEVPVSFIPLVNIDVQFKQGQSGARINGELKRGRFGLCLAEAVRAYQQRRELRRDQLLGLLPAHNQTKTALIYFNRIKEYLAKLGVSTEFRRDKIRREIKAIVFPEVIKIKEDIKPPEVKLPVERQGKNLLVKGVPFKGVEAQAMERLIPTYHGVDESGELIEVPQQDLFRLVQTAAEATGQTVTTLNLAGRTTYLVDKLDEELNPIDLEIKSRRRGRTRWLRLADLVKDEVSGVAAVVEQIAEAPAEVITPEPQLGKAGQEDTTGAKQSAVISEATPGLVREFGMPEGLAITIFLEGEGRISDDELKGLANQLGISSQGTRGSLAEIVASRLIGMFVPRLREDSGDLISQIRRRLGLRTTRGAQISLGVAESLPASDQEVVDEAMEAEVGRIFSEVGLKNLDYIFDSKILGQWSISRNRTLQLVKQLFGTVPTTGTHPQLTHEQLVWLRVFEEYARQTNVPLSQLERSFGNIYKRLYERYKKINNNL